MKTILLKSLKNDKFWWIIPQIKIEIAKNIVFLQ